MTTEHIEESLEKVEKRSKLSILRNWDFSALFVGGFISNIGSYFTMIAIIFLALEITSDLTPEASTQAVALMTTFSLIPMLILGPIAGVLVDKIDRKKVMYIADFFGASISVGLLFATQMWHLYIFSVASSSIRQFFYPAKSASMPRIVKQKELLSANGLIQTSAQLARILGPLIAGFITAIFGLHIAFIVDGITFLASAIFIMSIKRNLKPPKVGERLSIRKVGSGLKEGFQLTFSDKILRFLVILFGFTILAIGTFDPLIVPFLNFEFGLGEKEFGILMSFSAVSGLIGAIILSVKGNLKNKLYFLSYIIILLSFVSGFIALAPFLPGKAVWVYVGMSIVGMVQVGFNIPFSTLLQTIVKNEHLGKISGIIDTVITTSSLIASTIAATLAGFASISLILGVVTIMLLVAGITGVAIIKRFGLEALAQEREAKASEERKMKELQKLETEERIVERRKEGDKIPLLVEEDFHPTTISD